MFAALAQGTSTIRDYSGGEDNESTAHAFQAMGVTVERAGERIVKVTGNGLFGLKAPSKQIDCGNSGTTMRLLSGVLAAQRFTATMIGDESLSGRPMMRVADPLRRRGAVITGRQHPKKPEDICAPLVVGPLPEGKSLTGIEFESRVSSAQVKSALLLSGLYAEGATYFREPLVSRDHTERIMHALGVPLRTIGTVVELDPARWSRKLPAFEMTVPGDLSASAFLLAAGAIVEGSDVHILHVGVNPTRTGFLEIARDFGAEISVEPKGDASGEPVADLRARCGILRGARFGGETVTRAVDEVPIACALAARAIGETRIVDAAELRVKESDRLATMATVLRAFGVEADELPDGLVIRGKEGKLKAAEIDSRGDHRIAMTGVVMALSADGPSLIRNAGCIATSFPTFANVMTELGAQIEIVADEG